MGNFSIDVQYTRQLSTCVGVGYAHSAQSQSPSMLKDFTHFLPTRNFKCLGYIYSFMIKKTDFRRLFIEKKGGMERFKRNRQRILLVFALHSSQADEHALLIFDNVQPILVRLFFYLLTNVNE